MPIPALAMLLPTGDAISGNSGRCDVVVDYDVKLLLPTIFGDRRPAPAALRSVAGLNVLASVGDLHGCCDAQSWLAKCADPGVLDASRDAIRAKRIACVTSNVARSIPLCNLESASFRGRKPRLVRYHSRPKELRFAVMAVVAKPPLHFPHTRALGPLGAPVAFQSIAIFGEAPRTRFEQLLLLGLLCSVDIVLREREKGGVRCARGRLI